MYDGREAYADSYDGSGLYPIPGQEAYNYGDEVSEDKCLHIKLSSSVLLISTRSSQAVDSLVTIFRHTDQLTVKTSGSKSIFEGPLSHSRFGMSYYLPEGMTKDSDH